MMKCRPTGVCMMKCRPNGGYHDTFLDPGAGNGPGTESSPAEGEQTAESLAQEERFLYDRGDPGGQRPGRKR